MLRLNTVFYDIAKDLRGTDSIPTSLLVFRERIDEETFRSAVDMFTPLSAILAWDVQQPYAISIGADRARAHFPRVGIIYPGEDINFFLWAVDRGYSPIVMLPEQKTTQRRLLDLHAHGYLSRPCHIHLPGAAAEGVTPTTFPNVVFSTGVAW